MIIFIIFCSSVYFNNGANLAFDFGQPVIRAAFQTVLAYNPELFLSDKGIYSCNSLFLDAVGNVWGSTISPGPKKTGVPQQITVTASDDAKLFLILPACLNPAGFTPNVANKKSQDELRMPLMNRFVLSSMVTGTESDSIANFQDYQNQILTVIGLKSLSPYTLNSDNVTKNTWSKEQRNQDLASALYNYKEIGISKSESSRGIASIDSYAYIAFCMNVGYLKGPGTDDGEIDLKTGWFQIFGCSNHTFSLFKDDIDKQKQFLTYFFTPTLLPLDKVSMNFYRYTPTDTQKALEDEWGEFFLNKDEDSGEEGKIYNIDKISTTGLASTQITSMGLAGMGLYIEDIAVYSHKAGTENDEANVYVTPSQLVPSRFVREVVAEKGYNPESAPMPYDMYDGLTKGTYNITEENHKLAKLFFLDSMNTVELAPGLDVPALYGMNFFEKDSSGTMDIVKRYKFDKWTDGMKTKARNAIEDDWLKLVSDVFIEAMEILLTGSAARLLNMEFGPYHWTSLAFTFGFSVSPNNFGPSCDIGVYLIIPETMCTDGADGRLTADSAFVNSLPFVQAEELQFGVDPSSTTGIRILNKNFVDAIKKIKIDIIFFLDGDGCELNFSSFTGYLGKKPEECVDNKYLNITDAYINKVYKAAEVTGGSVDTEDGDYTEGEGENKTTKTGTKKASGSVSTNRDSIEKYLHFGKYFITDYVYYYIGPSTDTVVNVGNNNSDITLGSLLGFNDSSLRKYISQATNKLTNYIGFGGWIKADDMYEWALAHYGYSVMYPAYGLDIVGLRQPPTLKVMGQDPDSNTTSTMRMGELGQNYLMGIYLGYIVDMMGMGVGSGTEGKVNFGSFYSPFLPRYEMSAKGGNMSLNNMDANSISGVEKSENIGVTAGASTPENIIKSVIEKIEKI